jgi:AcrR family transcriptional regulator
MSREEVNRSQRERLFGAMVAAVAEKGYEASTVADALELSGVSRSAFYEHFANKDECLVAATEALIDPMLTALGEVAALGGSPETVFERFLELVESEPVAARVCFIELHAAGELGEAAADRAIEAMASLIVKLNSGAKSHARLSPELARTLVGGLRKLIHTRLHRGSEGELKELAPGLWNWLTSIEPPPGKLAAPRRQRPATNRFEGYTPSERIARAVAAVVAEKGYLGMSTNDIAARAAISLSTFYAHFKDKGDAVLAALEMGGAQMMASAVPAARRAGSWQEGVRILYETMSSYFVAEPEMAQLALVGVYGAGPAALGRRDRVIDSLAQMLAPALEENPTAAAVSTEAVGATVYSLLREQVRRKGPQSLPAAVPLATYITLVGFVGAERALEVANGKGPR